VTAAGAGQEQPGDVLDGRYRIEGTLGQGGFGVVYRATQLDLGRTVAVKVLLPSAVQNAETLKRFRREAELTQHLAHPNTVTLYAYGQSASGAPYTVWEMLTGQPIDAVLKTSGAMNVGRVQRIGEQVLKSLIEAHQAGIVHRDIKPANLFLCQFAGEPDFLKVLDFGIAAVGDAGTGQLTREGQSVGTPSYMSPEQVVGDLDVDGRCDLYALGLVLAEMLTGQIVMQGNSGMRICIEQMSNNPVPIPPAVQACPLGPIITRATQKKREQRYANASEMLAALQARASSLGTGAGVVVSTGEFYGESAPTVGVTSQGASSTGAHVVPSSFTPHAAVAQAATGGQSVVARAGKGKWMFGGALALVLMGGTAGVAAWSPWDAGSRADGQKLKAPKAKRTKVIAQLEDYEFRGKTAQSLLDEMADRHYEVKMDPYVNKSKDFTAINYILGHTLGDSGGTIQFHRYRSKRKAKEAAEVNSSVLATRTHGKFMLGLSMDRDLEESDEILDELLK